MPGPRLLPLGASCLRSRVSRFRYFQVNALLLTFVLYVILHAARKTFANIKPALRDAWTPTMFNGDGDACENFFGTLDALFMFAYAIGLVVLGTLGDRFDMRLVLAAGMVGPALPIGAFAAGGALGINSPAYYAVLWFANGLIQSLVWPSVVAVVGNWYGVGTRGLVMGLWSGNASAGNIVGALITTPVLAAYGWQGCFVCMCGLLVAGGVASLLLLAPHPRDVDLPHLGREGTGGDLAAAIEAALQRAGRRASTARALFSGDAAALDSEEDGRGHTIAKTVRSEEGGDVGVALLGAEHGDRGDRSSTLIRTAPSPHDAAATRPPDGAKPPLPPTAPTAKGAAVWGDDGSSSGGHGTHDDAGTYEEDGDDSAGPPHGSGGSDIPKAISLFQAFLLPGVIVWSLCYAAVKSCNYTLFYWLPYYLTDDLGWSNGDADSYSSLNDVGGILGGAAVGWVTDRIGSRSIPLVGELLVNVVVLLLFRLYASTPTTVSLLCFLMGWMTGGPANLISSAIAADLGDAVQGNEAALATVAGIIDGTASIGAAITQELVPFFHTLTGSWDAVFYLLMCLSGLAALLLTRVVGKDVRRLWPAKA